MYRLTISIAVASTSASYERPAVDEKPAWSPDGKQLMIISNRGTSGKPDPYDIYLVDLGGGKAEPLGLTAKVVLTPVWSYR